MELDPNVREQPEVSEEERASIELLKRIRKLRWMGMQKEAEEMQLVLKMQLPTRPIQLAGTLLADPADTD
jgi:hypothetical protein